MMNRRYLLVLAIYACGLFLNTGMTHAAPDAGISYIETDLGGGLWQYDYTLYNLSTNNEYLYSVDLLFDQTSTVTGEPLPSGWSSAVWEGQNQTDYIMTFSTGLGYDIAAGNSLSGFNFTVDYQAGDTSYNAYFDDHAGGFTSTSGTTSGIGAMVPEPLSAVLFVVGGMAFGIRRLYR
jgi:hypothetical protein